VAAVPRRRCARPRTGRRTPVPPVMCESSRVIARDRQLSGYRSRLAEWPERGAYFLGEQLRLFPGGEVAAAGGLVVVGEIGIARLDPATRGLPDLAGERGEADDRERDRRRRLASRGRGGAAV